MLKALNNFQTILYLLIFLIIMAMQVWAGNPTWEKGTPKHHTTTGFRNFPIVEDSSEIGFSFYMHRFISAFNLPVAPENHILSEESAIALYQKLQDKNTVTWIGQSTMLIKIDGKCILTDPFFSKYASPFPIGPSRYVNPGISPENLPQIDIILISHNHYDHLDEDFIESIPKKENIHVFVPLKLEAFFSKRGYTNVHELDWYESESMHNIEFTALPTVHYSGRGIGDKNDTLWCGWSISNRDGKLFFIGDSAYSPVIFKEIGTKFNSFNLAMVTIGTYGNRKYGVNNHTTPEKAVTIGKEIKAKVLLGIHWGTIDLSDEDPWEPPKRFKVSAEKSGFLSEEAWIMKIGETRRLPGM
ncbi:MAG: MBL fold metallo-hydrolase [Deltaproteobacteria bacterium]|jgi:L-ascorbate metabolism protein UlaG (beta-lactamase superfamily)|nr:MBL fold metallo-hydrolase [Deltaproteobacteria bacterium]MBW2239040.1 MBL fold metallo-hydrolase [Deltaproteobacteria bacterium]MBW2572813.1 MBL fold metallo-hydrolase [Deltaproteobacteria bacterium]